MPGYSTTGMGIPWEADMGEGAKIKYRPGGFQEKA